MAEFHTVPELFLHRIGATPNGVAFMYPDGGGWKSVNWREFGEKVKQASMGLRALGLSNEQRVAILAGTRFDWVVADLGILCARRRHHHHLPVEHPRRLRLHHQRLQHACS